LDVVNPNMKIILITPATLDATRWPHCSSFRAAEYANCIRQLASEDNNSLFLLDLWKDIPLITAEGDEDASFAKSIQEEDLNDGLHLGQSGNRKVLYQLKHLIRYQCPAICPEQFSVDGDCLEMHFPHWSELTKLPPEEALQTLKDWKWST